MKLGFRKNGSSNQQQNRREFLLKASLISIHLPAKARIVDLGERNETTEPEYPLDGGVDSRYNVKEGVWEIFVDWTMDPNRPMGSLFVRAHEEGHICQDTGNLIRLYRVAKDLGLEDLFEMNELEVRTLDKRAKRNLRMTPPDLEDLPNYGDERTADICGLIALVNSGCDERIIRRVIEQVKRDNHSFSRGIPDLIYSLE